MSKEQSYKNSQSSLILNFRETNGIRTFVKRFGMAFMRRIPKGEDPHSFAHIYSNSLSGLTDVLNNYIEVYELCDISRSQVQRLRQVFYEILLPEGNGNRDSFREHLLHVLSVLNTTDRQLVLRLRHLNALEAFRLDEARKCLQAGSALGAIVMAVSAVEHRLHRLLEKHDPRTYKMRFRDATLGAIVSVFRVNSSYQGSAFDRLRKRLPDKHRPLMELLNVYRIFSAHPKDEIVTHQTARIILALSFVFLMDESLAG